MTDLSPAARHLAIVVHRDVGYLLTVLLVGYCLSGLALNHVDDWNPDFVIEKRAVQVGARAEVDEAYLQRLSALVDEGRPRLVDRPTPDQLKLYYRDATLHVHLATGEAAYERVRRRPLFYEVNVLHRNTIDGWRWLSDAFAIALIAVTLTGLVILKGRNGLGGRGKWLVLAGLVPPVVALLLHEFTN